MALIAVDFDGTIVDGSEPLLGAREAINLLREHGHKIMIYSCNGMDWIKKVLNNADIRYDSIWGELYMERKPVASLYVDDRGYHFKGDWKTDVQDILARLEIYERTYTEARPL